MDPLNGGRPPVTPPVIAAPIDNAPKAPGSPPDRPPPAIPKVKAAAEPILNPPADPVAKPPAAAPAQPEEVIVEPIDRSKIPGLNIPAPEDKEKKIEPEPIEKVVNAFNKGIKAVINLGEQGGDYYDRIGIYKNIMVLQRRPASVDGNMVIELWDISLRQVIKSVEFPTAREVNWYLNKNTIYFPLETGFVLSYDLETGRQHHIFGGSEYEIRKLYTQAGFLIGISDRNNIVIWNKNTGELLDQIPVGMNIQSIWIDAPDSSCTDLSKVEIITSHENKVFKWDIKTKLNTVQENTPRFKKIKQYGDVKIIKKSDTASEIFVGKDSKMNSDKVCKVRVQYDRIAVLETDGNLTVFAPLIDKTFKVRINKNVNGVQDKIEFLSPSVLMYVSQNGLIQLIDIEEKQGKRILKEHKIENCVATAFKVRKEEKQVVYIEKKAAASKIKNAKVFGIYENAEAVKKAPNLSELNRLTEAPSNNLFSKQFTLPNPASSTLELICNIAYDVLATVGILFCGLIYYTGVVIGGTFGWTAWCLRSVQKGLYNFSGYDVEEPEEIQAEDRSAVPVPVPTVAPLIVQEA